MTLVPQKDIEALFILTLFTENNMHNNITIVNLPLWLFYRKIFIIKFVSRFGNAGYKWKHNIYS